MKNTTFSTLVAMPNDFANTLFRKHVKNTAKNVNNFDRPKIGCYTRYLGRTHTNDNGLIAEKVKELVLKNEYHKAYVYLKEKVNKFVRINGDFVVKPLLLQ